MISMNKQEYEYNPEL